MKMQRKVVKVSLLVIALMISITIPILAVTAKKKEWNLDYPIIIDEYSILGPTWADLVNEPWLKGSGTFEDPYIIKNVVIDGEDFPFPYCMLISNSRVFFEIQDCTFSNAKSAGLVLVNTQNGVVYKNSFLANGLGEGAGIALISSHDNKIQKNLCDENPVGIYLQSSSYNLITQNLCTGNIWMGIYILGGSSYNTVTKNDCIDNGGNGINLEYSNDNLVTQNLCKRNNWGGIYIGDGSSYNKVTKNDCIENLEGIILIHEANNNEIERNNCSNNYGNGIYLSNNANNNLITRNDCFNNQGTGIVVETSNGNVISNNDCNENLAAGIALKTSNEHTITDNECSDNGGGISIEFSNDNLITQNLCARNDWGGIYIGDESSYNEVTKNDCIENLEGIILIHEANNNEIIGNNCSNNNGNGMFLHNNANHNLIAENDCYDNFGIGIVVEISTRNYIINNDCKNNLNHGISLIASNEHILYGNNCSENGGTGINLEESNDNSIINNVCNENLFSGIWLESSYGNFISENNCSESIRGIHLRFSNDNLITQNLCTVNTWGIVINTWSSNNDVTNNDCVENGDGIVIANYATDNRITDNTCTNNYENGISLWKDANYNIISQNNCSENLLSGIWVASSSGTVISLNDCNDNGESGIYVFDPLEINARDNILYGNMITGNLNGIHFSEADNNDIFMNTIKENDIGMLVEGQSQLNLIFHNNFIDNVVQAVNENTGLNNWHNIYMLEGNYWDDYEGEDGNLDGIGDTPWPGPEFDVYPFKEENGWEILTPIEEEILNARTNPETNRFGGGLDYRADEKGYLIVGLGQLFSERTHDTWIPPFTCRLWFNQTVNGEVVEVESYFQGNLWSLEWSTFYQELVWANLYYLIIPPNVINLPPGNYPFKWGVSFYSGGEQQFRNYTTSFVIPEPE